VSNLGLVYWHEGRLREAKTAFNKAQELAIQTGNHYTSLAAEIMLAYTLVPEGGLRQAEESLRKLLQAGGENPMTALTYHSLAGIYYEWIDLSIAW
jgi:Flp pilus assembly protein TadD